MDDRSRLPEGLKRVFFSKQGEGARTKDYPDTEKRIKENQDSQARAMKSQDIKIKRG